jgi:hypothetical protein
MSELKTPEQIMEMHNSGEYDFSESEVTIKLKDLVSLLNTHQPGWVSVEDRNPDKDGKYIVMVNGGLIEMDRFYKDWARYGGFVTHWMPLPPKPPEN